MTDTGHQSLSTSALAKTLALSAQQLFGVLSDYGWIKRVDDSWILTAKGEFEGGEYVHSKKFGRYIVWPHTIADHPLFRAMESNRTVSAKALGEKYHLNAREVNRMLAELGWLMHTSQGWELTLIGEKLGGIQYENEQSGTFYVLWPENIQQNQLLKQQFHLYADANNDEDISGDDLFSQAVSYVSIDGHSFTKKAQLSICQWLYLAGFTHACHRKLPTNETLYADFYLPVQRVYIEYWDKTDNSADLANKMNRKAIYETNHLSVIEIEPKDLNHLDEVMTKKLRKLGIRVI